MNPFDQPDPESAPAETAVDPAIRASVAVPLFGKPLAPYTRRRYAAAQSMGLLYPCIGDEGLAQYQSTGLYPGQVRDVILLLWICLTPHEADLTEQQRRAAVLSVESALAAPRRAAALALAWGEAHGLLDPDDPRFAEAHAAFTAIVAPVEESRFEVSIAGAQGGAPADPKPSPPAPTPNTP